MKIIIKAILLLNFSIGISIVIAQDTDPFNQDTFSQDQFGPTPFEEGSLEESGLEQLEQREMERDETFPAPEQQEQTYETEIESYDYYPDDYEQRQEPFNGFDQDGASGFDDGYRDYEYDESDTEAPISEPYDPIEPVDGF